MLHAFASRSLRFHFLRPSNFFSYRSVSRPHFSRSMKLYVKVLGTQSHDMTPSVLVHFDSRRYLFNCGEGTQRFCAEHKIRLSNLQHIFLTRTHWECMGGLPGMILTLAESQPDRRLDILGPPQTTRALCSTRYFVQRPQMKVTTCEFGIEAEDLVDENMRVTAVPIQASVLSIGEKVLIANRLKQSLDDAKRALGKMFANPCNRSRSPPPKRRMCSEIERPDDPRAVDESLIASLQSECTLADETSLCYICEGHELKPKFDNKRAQELKVPKGPIRAKLVHGESVTLEDGRIIQPSDVCHPARAGAIFIFMDVPSMAYLPSVLENQRFKEFQTNMAVGYRLQCMIHSVDTAVLQSQEYRAFIRAFPNHVQHIILNADYNVTEHNFTSAAIQQAKLAQIDPSIYCQPYSSLCPKLDVVDLKLGTNVKAGKPLMEVHIEPEPTRFVDMPMVDEDQQKKITELNVHVSQEDIQSRVNVKAGDPLISFLGTGSMLPSKYRNVSSIMVKTETGSILFDCGEGTYGQLFRLFGPDNVQEVLRQLQCIFISHMHADHHLGTVRLIQKWDQANQFNPHARLLLIAPQRMWSFINDYATCRPYPTDRIDFIDAVQLLLDSEVPQLEFPIGKYKELLNLAEIGTFKVNHCPNAYGLGMTVVGGMHIMYSGDTRPTYNIPVAAQILYDRCKASEQKSEGKLVLIHEATYDDSMTTEAIERKHSTVSEAISISKQSDASYLLLTHFSQRYPKLSAKAEKARRNSISKKLAIGSAFDFMMITPSKISSLQLLEQELEQIFGVSDDEEDSSINIK